MAIEVSLLISGISVAFAIYFGICNKKRNETHDTREETEKETQNNTMVMTKLESISDDIKEIKAENKNFREDISNLRERVAKVESSLKSYHKRLDDENVSIQ